MSIATHARRAPAREADLQRAIVAYCRAVLPNGLVFAVPNSSQRTRTGRASNAVPGLMAGVTDLIVLAPRCAIFAEIKTATGKVRPEQDAFMDRARALGFHAAVWRSVEDARNTFAALRIETREAARGNG